MSSSLRRLRSGALPPPAISPDMAADPPRDWSELQALAGRPETSRLDFKESLPANPKIAKAVAAMSVAGGAVVFGIPQDQGTGLALAPAPIADLAKAEERVAQVIGTLIEPPPKFTLEAIHDPAAPGQGALVVRVPRSVIGPHAVDGRFPIRAGTTTRWMSAEEVAAIHRENRETRPRPSELMEAAEFLPEIPPVRVRSIYDGFGQLRVAARPREGALEHPEAPWLGAPLAAAALAACERASARLAVYAPTLTLPALAEWDSVPEVGWVAGRAGQAPGYLAREPSVAAVLAYPWRTLVQLTVPTTVAGAGGAPPYLCAQEGRIGAELWGTLAFLGELYAAAGAVTIDLAVHLAGFRGAVSYHATHAREGLAVAHLPPSGHGTLRLITVDSEDLRDAPEDSTREFLDPWLVDFYRGGDLIDYVTVPRRSGTRLT